MAWEKTHKVIVNDLTKQKVWQVWEDVNNWHLWDSDIEYAKLDGAFVANSCFSLKPKVGPMVKLKLLTVEPERAFTDVTFFPFARMYGIHEMKETGVGLEISRTVRIEGPLSFLWKKVVAEKVAADIDEQAWRMIHRARELEKNG